MEIERKLVHKRGNFRLGVDHERTLSKVLAGGIREVKRNLRSCSRIVCDDQTGIDRTIRVDIYAPIAHWSGRVNRCFFRNGAVLLLADHGDTLANLGSESRIAK